MASFLCPHAAGLLGCPMNPAGDPEKPRGKASQMVQEILSGSAVFPGRLPSNPCQFHVSERLPEVWTRNVMDALNRGSMLPKIKVHRRGISRSQRSLSTPSFFLQGAPPDANMKNSMKCMVWKHWCRREGAPLLHPSRCRSFQDIGTSPRFTSPLILRA